MGLGAAVYCNCWKEGKTTEPPVPREWVQVDEDCSVYMMNPLWSPMPSRETEAYERAMATYITFDKWVANQACPHEDMHFAYARISNVSGVSGFRHALEMASEDRFATILAELPMGNDGTMSPVAAARVLDELDTFVSLSPYGTLAVLIDEASGETIWEVAQGHRSLFQGSGKEQMTWNLDEYGFVIIDIRTAREFNLFDLFKLELKLPSKRELFRSMRFTQQRMGDLFEYRDVETGIVFRSRMGIGDQGEAKHHFRVGFKQQASEQYAGVVEALRIVCRASVQSGNPVVWL